MTEQAQVGDTVRLTVTSVFEGTVEKWVHGGRLHMQNRALDDPNHMVEILLRAAPLPSEPGTWWLDVTDDVWFVDHRGIPHRSGADWVTPDAYAPFRQLVLK